VENLEWIIHHAEAEKLLLNKKYGECINIFLPIEVGSYYKLKDVEVRLNKYFVVAFYQCHNTSLLLTSWWREDKKFVNRASVWYNTVNLLEPYIFLMALFCCLYGENDCSKLFEDWIPLVYTIAIYGSIFNWGDIICNQLRTKIEEA
jgi:hypothetical protein